VCKIVGKTARQADEPLSKKQLRRIMQGFEDQHAAVPVFHKLFWK